MDAEAAYEASPKKFRIYAQMFAYERYSIPKVTMQKSPVDGLMYPVTENYKEYEGRQLAVNHNDLYISESNLDMLLKNLCVEIKKDLRDKGMIK